MKKFKGTFKFALSVVVSLVLMVGATACGGGGGGTTTDKDFSFKMNESGDGLVVRIALEKERPISKLVVPETHEGIPVTEIEGLIIWKNPENVKTLVLPKTIKKIGKGVISSFGIKSFTVKKDVEYVGSNCQYLEELESIIIEDGVEIISTEMFKGCKKLTKVTIPASVKIIEPYAFNNCESLTDVEFLSESTKLQSGYGGGDFSFSICPKLSIKSQQEIEKRKVK